MVSDVMTVVTRVSVAPIEGTLPAARTATTVAANTVAFIGNPLLIREPSISHDCRAAHRDPRGWLRCAGARTKHRDGKAQEAERNKNPTKNQNNLSTKEFQILQRLAHCCGNHTRAAGVLRISIRTLRDKIREYEARGLAVPEPSRCKSTEPATLR